MQGQRATILMPEGVTGIDLMKRVEYAGRNCYASRDRITDDSYKKFIHNLVAHDHGSPLEFADLTFELVTSRDVMCELTRHRLASFQIESQRYVNYGGKPITFIMPPWYNQDVPDDRSMLWLDSMEEAARNYQRMIDLGLRPEEARVVLPNSTACKIVIKANLREFRHIFSLRCSARAYPQMRELSCMMLELAHTVCPDVFEDQFTEFIKNKGE